MSKNRKPHKRGEFVPIGDVAWAIGTRVFGHERMLLR